ncbi:hypothetical protein SB659_13240 [Arthrobacter sp. SIMBA_036]|uniref:hypothetical protein n=1 Tax=Arthrobacter sp. SIMBA_036 TaxID=3085778 RepID=UPI00397D0F8F
MESFTWAKATTTGQERAKVAVLLPGSGYPVEGPVLFWSGEILAALGWHVQAVRWTPGDAPSEDPHSFVTQAAELAFAATPQAAQRLIVAKSLSTLSIPWADAAQIPGIWLTPLLTDGLVRATLPGGFSKDDLFIGGSEDRLWDGGGGPDDAGTFFEVPGADHSLQIPNDWRASQRAQAEVFARIEEIVVGLAKSPARRL